MKLPRLSALTQGFTLVEIMVVVGILGAVLALALPNFMQARAEAQQQVCISTLRLLNAAVERWAVENNQGSDDDVTLADVRPYFRQETIPPCPSGGQYSTSKVALLPKCSLGPTEGHALFKSDP